MYLLNLSRKDPVGDSLLGSAHPGTAHHGGFEDAIPTDSMTAFGTRRSMQARRSSSAESAAALVGRHERNRSWGSNPRRSGEALMGDFRLEDLVEDEHSEEEGRRPNGAGVGGGEKLLDEETGVPMVRLKKNGEVKAGGRGEGR